MQGGTPKGYQDSIDRVRQAFIRKEELKKAHSNLGKPLGKDEDRRNGKLVAEPFKFKHSAAYREKRTKQLKDTENKDRADKQFQDLQLSIQKQNRLAQRRRTYQ